MSAEDELLQAGLRDAAAALTAMQDFNGLWQKFAEACQARQFDVAHGIAERMVSLVEMASDMYLTSNRRLAQFDRLTKGNNR